MAFNCALTFSYYYYVWFPYLIPLAHANRIVKLQSFSGLKLYTGIQWWTLGNFLSLKVSWHCRLLMVTNVFPKLCQIFWLIKIWWLWPYWLQLANYKIDFTWCRYSDGIVPTRVLDTVSISDLLRAGGLPCKVLLLGFCCLMSSLS